MGSWLLLFCVANINHSKWPFFSFSWRLIIFINCYRHLKYSRQKKNSREWIFSSGSIVEYCLQFCEGFLCFICPAEEDQLTCYIKYPWRFKPSKKTLLGAVLEELSFWNKPYVDLSICRSVFYYPQVQNARYAALSPKWWRKMKVCHFRLIPHCFPDITHCSFSPWASKSLCYKFYSGSFFIKDLC